MSEAKELLNNWREKSKHTTQAFLELLSHYVTAPLSQSGAQKLLFADDKIVFELLSHCVTAPLSQSGAQKLLFVDDKIVFELLSHYVTAPLSQSGAMC